MRDYLLGKAGVVYSDAFRMDVFRVGERRTENFHLSFHVASGQSDYFLRVLVTLDPSEIDESRYIQGVFMDFITYDGLLSSCDLIALLPDEEQRMELCDKVRKDVLFLWYGTYREKVYSVQKVSRELE